MCRRLRKYYVQCLLSGVKHVVACEQAACDLRHRSDGVFSAAMTGVQNRRFRLGALPLDDRILRMKTADEQIVRDVLSSQGQIRQAIIFGSTAFGTQHRDSDLDLAVSAERPLTAAEKTTLIAALAVATGRPVDLVDLQTVGEPLLGQILRHGKRILGTDSEYAALIRRHVFDQADFSPYRDRILAERRRAWIGR